MASQVKNMTSGNPAKLIFFFALPLMMGNIFQQLYTVVDTMIVGQGVGVEALAALGAADWLNWLTIGLIQGFTQGFSILHAQMYGANDIEGLRRSVGLSIVLSSIIGVVVTISSLLSISPILALLGTPSNIVDMSRAYLVVIFSGLPIVMAYNVVASILRAMGNGRTPLIAMVIACFINIALDFLFVFTFQWGVAGAAAATVIAQAFSFIYCLFILRKIPELKLSRDDFRPDSFVIGRLLKLGTPMAFQNTIISVGGMVVQYVVNRFGFIFVAGFTAANKLYGILEVAATSYGFSMSTYAGQNLGAGKLDRIRIGMRWAVFMAAITSAVIGIFMIFFGRPIISLFVSGDPSQAEQVIDVAYKYLFIMSATLFVLYILHLYRSALQGLGNTVIPMISGMVELIMRVAAAFLLPMLVGGQDGIYYAEIMAWCGAVAILTTAYYAQMRRLVKSADVLHTA